MVGPRALALDRVRPRRDLPLELHLRHEARLRAAPSGGSRRSPSGSRCRRGPPSPSPTGGRTGRRRCRWPRSVSLRLSNMRGEATHEYLSAKSRACGLGSVTLFHGWRLSIALPSGSWVTNVSSLLQSSKYERAEQDADREVDLDQVGRDQLAAEHEARRDVPVRSLYAGGYALKATLPEQHPVLWSEHFDVAATEDEVIADLRPATPSSDTVCVPGPMDSAHRAVLERPLRRCAATRSGRRRRRAHGQHRRFLRPWPKGAVIDDDRDRGRNSPGRGAARWRTRPGVRNRLLDAFKHFRD